MDTAKLQKSGHIKNHLANAVVWFNKVLISLMQISLIHMLSKIENVPNTC